MTALSSRGCGKITVLYIKGTLATFILTFRLFAGVLSPSILGRVINTNPDWMGSLGLSNMCSIWSFMQQFSITLLLRKALRGVVITIPFLYKDDILYAPEKQFVSGKLHGKHLLAKYIWEVCNGSSIGSIFCLVVSLGVMNWENVSFSET